MSKAGFFITFEGGEGGGKTTQINRLAEKLTADGHKVITTREPGGTDEGEKIRDLLVQREGGNWSPLAEVLLLYADRVMHIEKIVKPALDSGNIVISDRFADSTFAYQGYGHGLPLEDIQKINDLVLGDLRPDLTFVLDIDVKEGLERSGRRLAAEELNIKQTEDRFENLDLEFHERLRQGFLEIAKNDEARCCVIDAAQELDDIQAEIQKIVSERLS